MTVASASKLAIAFAFAFLFVVWIANPWVFGDTPFVLDASNALITCLSAHQFRACGFTGELDYWGLMSPMGDWPLLQHVPDLIAIGLGAESHPTRTRVLELLNVAGVAGALLAARAALVRVGESSWFWGFALIVLSGPIIWYARTTSGEVLAAALLVCLVAATVVPAPPPLVGLAALGAALTKETSYPFVIAFGLLGLVLARRRTGKPIRPHVLWGAAGLGVALVAASLFNVVRYGSVLNTNLLDSGLHAPGIARKLDHAAALVLAPNGGTLFFWPIATLLVVAACLLSLFRRRRLDMWPAAALAAVALALILGFASWWTPFGWAGFGPRLLVPWLPPLVLLALVAYGGDLLPLVQRLLAPWWRLLVVFVVVLVFTLPAIGQMWRPGAIQGFFALADPPCQAPFRPDGGEWYACQHRQMWQDKPMQLYALHGVRTLAGLATSFVVAAGIAGCLLLLRQPPLAEQRARAE
jgi:hypothetical protein